LYRDIGADIIYLIIFYTYYGYVLLLLFFRRSSIIDDNVCFFDIVSTPTSRAALVQP